MTQFPNKNNVLTICASFLANGSSSYRDANNMEKITKRVWNSNVFILTDNLKYCNGSNPNHILIENKDIFLKTIEDLVSKFSKTHDILFQLSSHGYSGGRDETELNNRNEYIIINKQTVFDHDIRNSFYKNMNEECLSLCLIDTCHSGTMLDLPWYSCDGISFKNINQPLIIKPESYCIGACNDNELAGEDISNYGGWGGKLICVFLDYLNNQISHTFIITDFYLYVNKTFTTQKYQRSHPILSKTTI